jgi:hypothetical protein
LGAAGAEGATGAAGAAGAAGAEGAEGALGAAGAGASSAFKVTRTVSFLNGTAEVLVIGFGGFGASSLIFWCVIVLAFSAFDNKCFRKLTKKEPPLSNPQQRIFGIFPVTDNQ